MNNAHNEVRYFQSASAVGSPDRCKGVEGHVLPWGKDLGDAAPGFPMEEGSRDRVGDGATYRFHQKTGIALEASDAEQV